MCTYPPRHMVQKRVVSLDQAAPVQEGAPPYVQPGANAHALGYSAGVAVRRGLPKYNTPVAGGPPPPIPALEQPHNVGMTMAAQAAATRGQDAARHVNQAISSHVGNSIVVPDSGHSPPPQNFRPQDLPLRPTDVLPDEALKDPSYHHGMGSRTAQSQPHMAAKYGVIRDGRHVMADELMGARGPGPTTNAVRVTRSAAEIASDLQKVLMVPAGPGAQRQGPPAGYISPRETEDEGPTPPRNIPRTEEEARAQAERGPGAPAAYALGNPADASPTPSLTPEEEEARAQRLVNEMDDFDFENLRRQMMSDVLKNPAQQREVEARLKPMDIGDLIMRNVIEQRVPIKVGVFEPTFQSMQGDVELKLKQLLVKESKSISVTESYLLDKYAVMTTAAGIVAVNGRPAPPMFDERGDFSETLFWEKFNWTCKRNIHMLASLGIHYAWFEQRVRKLFVADEGKGG